MDREQQVRAAEEAMWETMRQADLEAYAALVHDELLGWPKEEPAPIGKKAAVAGLREILSQLELIAYRLEPTVKFLDETLAAVFYGYVSTWRYRESGDEVEVTGHVAHTWSRSGPGGGWKLICGFDRAAEPASGAAS